MTQTAPPAVVEAADVVTVVQDQTDDEVLFSCAGALLPPRGTLIELAGGERVCLASVRVVAPTREHQVAQVILSVVPVPAAARRSDDEGDPR